MGAKALKRRDVLMLAQILPKVFEPFPNSPQFDPVADDVLTQRSVRRPQFT